MKEERLFLDAPLDNFQRHCEGEDFDGIQVN
jgi:hypothetical protein